MISIPQAKMQIRIFVESGRFFTEKCQAAVSNASRSKFEDLRKFRKQTKIIPKALSRANAKRESKSYGNSSQVG
jgi:hypothetical protein